MDWLMKYGARLFAVLTLLAAAWQTFGGGKPSMLQVAVFAFAALTVLTLFLPQPKVNTNIDTKTPPKSK